MFLLAIFGLALAGEFSQLYATEAEASSFLKSSWNKYNENYHPNYVLDNNPKTAWVEGVDGNGEGQKIVIPISAVSQIGRVKIRIKNGYQKSESLLKANAAPKEVLLEVLNRSGQPIAQQKATLTKTMGWQEIILKGENDLTAHQVVLTVLSSHDGTKYKDACISDIEVFVDAQTTYNEQVEQAKKSQLQQWTKERLETARYFASQPKTYPFAATAAKSSEPEQLTGQNFDAAASQMAEQHSLLNEMQKKKNWYTRNSKNELKHLPDGLYIGDVPSDIWDATALQLFETTKALAIDENNEEEETDDYEGEFTLVTRSVSNVRLKKRADGSVETLYFYVDHMEAGRILFRIHMEFVCTYNEQGQLVSLYQENFDTGEDGAGRRHHGEDIQVRILHLISYSDSGKIDQIVEHHYTNTIYTNTEYAHWVKAADKSYYEDVEYESEATKSELLGKSVSQKEISKQIYSFE